MYKEKVHFLITRSKNYSSKTRNIFLLYIKILLHYFQSLRGVVTLLTCTCILFLQSFLCVCSVKFNIFFLNIPLLVCWNIFLVFYIARGITSPPKIKFSLTQRIFMLSVVISILTKPVGKSLVLSRQLRKFSVAPHLACAVRYVGRNLFCRHDSPTEKLAFAITGRRLISYDTRVI